MRAASTLGCLGCLVCLVLLASAAGACVGLDGLAGGATPGGTNAVLPDGGRDNPCAKDLDGDHDNCGACGTICGGMEHCLAGTCAPGCPDHTVYVSADGNDNASGCTTATPKRTVGAAIALLKTLGAQKHEVHMCRGEYDEAVLLDYPTSILGAYECSTWKRSPSYGAPTFDGVNETVVRGTTTVPPLTALAIEGVFVDGVTLRAKDATTKRIPAAIVASRANVKLSNAKLLAGNGQANDSPGSVGLVVDTDAFADVSGSVVDGGGATNTSSGGYGSAGIFITAKGGGVHVTNARVTGGSGVVNGGTGSAGILALGGSTASIVETSNVNGGSGRTGGGSGSYGIGFFGATTSDITVTGSFIDGGTSSCPKRCAITGLATSAIGKVTITGNRIAGGEVKSDMLGDITFTGLHLTGYANADVQNNSVFSGNTKETFGGLGRAIQLTRGGNALVANNTFALGPSKSGAGSVVVASSTTATFADNLLLDGSSVTAAAAIDLDACDGRSYALQSNVFVGFPDRDALLQLSKGTTGTPTGCTSATSSTTVDALETVASGAFGPSKASGNRRIAAGCSGDTKCAASAECTNGPSCIPSVLTAWTKATAGDLLGAGWKLRTGVSCAIAKGGTSGPGLLMVDGYGVPRTDPRSIGAHEYDGSCTNP
jgi:hypothetical protein